VTYQLSLEDFEQALAENQDTTKPAQRARQALDDLDKANLSIKPPAGNEK